MAMKQGKIILMHFSLQKEIYRYVQKHKIEALFSSHPVNTKTQNFTKESC